MAKLHCKQCNSLAHRMINNVPYCNSCASTIISTEGKEKEEKIDKKEEYFFEIACNCCSSTTISGNEA